MQAIELHTEIDENGEIHLRIPNEVKARTARVIVLLDESTPFLLEADAFFAELERFAITPRSRKDIDEALEHERDDWY